MSDSPAQKSVDEPHSSRASSNSVDLPPEPEVITNDFNSHHNRPEDAEESEKEKHPIEDEPEIVKEEHMELGPVDRDHVEEKEMEHEKEEAALEMQEEYEEKERMNTHNNEENNNKNYNDGAEEEEKEGKVYKDEENREHDQDESSAANKKEISLYIGLGPAGRDIRMDDFRRFLETQASSPELIGDIRMRGRCAFVDIGNMDEAERLIEKLNNEMYEDLCRMTVEMSRNPRGSRIGGERDSFYGNSNRRPFSDERRDRRGYGELGSGPSHEFNHDGHPSLFIGLGPNGIHIPDHVIRQKLEDSVPILAFRRHGQCAFVDVEDDRAADKLIREVSNQYIDDARISVQFSRDNRKRNRSPMLRGNYRDNDQDNFNRRNNYDDEGYNMAGRARGGRFEDRPYGRNMEDDHRGDYYRRERERERGAPPLPPPGVSSSSRGGDRYYGKDEGNYAGSRSRREQPPLPAPPLDRRGHRRSSPAYSDHGRNNNMLEEEEEYYRSRKDDRNRYYDDKAYPARREAYNREHRTQDYKHRGRSLTPPSVKRYVAPSSQERRHRQPERRTHRRSPSRSRSRSRSNSSRYSRSSRSYSSRSRSMTPPRRAVGGNVKGEMNIPVDSAIPTNINSSSNNNNNVGNMGASLNRDGNTARRRSYSPSSRHSSMDRDHGSRRGARPAPRRM